jgi:hypothetical protein
LLIRFNTAVGRFDLYIIMNERSLTLLREQGMFGFIQPIKFGVFANGKLLREILLKLVQIERIVDVSQSHVFPDPSTYPCLLIFKKCLPRMEHKIIAIRPPVKNPKSICGTTINSEIILEIPQSRFLETPENVICLRLSDELWSIIKQVGKSSSNIETFFDIVQNIRIGSKSKRDSLVLDEYSYDSVPMQVKAECKKMLDGENIDRYAINWNGYWLHYLPGELYNPKTIDVLETPKILIKRVASRLTVVPDLRFDNDYFYPLNTIYSLVPKVEFKYSLCYITALLNSLFLDWYYKLLFESIAIRGGYIEYREYLKYLPIRNISFTTPEPERSRLVAELKELYEFSKFDQILATTDACLPKDAQGNFISEQEKSDVVHDLLNFLAERMLEMNREKQEEIRGFLGWLESYVGAKAEDLTYKIKMQKYYEHDFGDFLEVLKKNKKKLIVDPTRREPGQALQIEFENSKRKLGALRERIDQTNDLIDDVVYILYGLNDKKINIIKAPSQTN